ncbi:hypothetical protein D3C71_759510 [compost metagenome]
MLSSFWFFVRSSAKRIENDKRVFFGFQMFPIFPKGANSSVPTFSVGMYRERHSWEFRQTENACFEVVDQFIIRHA